MSDTKWCPHCGYEGALVLGEAATGAAKGAAAGAAVGSFIPFIGTAIGAAVGGAIGFIGGTSHYKCKKCKHEWDE